MALKAKWLSGLVALALCACQSSINTPPASPALSISPDSGRATLSIPTTFRLDLRNGQFPKSYTVQWTMDGNKKRILNADTLSYAFESIGLHTVQASLFDTSGNTILSARTTSQFDTEVMVLIQTTGQVGIGKPMTYTAVFADQHVPISLHWTFNDGIVLDTSATTISHTFNGPIIQQTSVTLFYGSSPIGSAFHVDSLKPDLSFLKNFHIAIISFVGANQASSDLVGWWGCGPFAVIDTQIVFEDAISIHGDSIVGSIISASLSSDLQSCASALATRSYQNSGCSTCPPPYTYNTEGSTSSGNESISLKTLPLLVFSPDSVVFGLDGPTCQSHVGYHKSASWTCCSCTQFYGTGAVSYSGTDWAGTPRPSLRLILYK